MRSRVTGALLVLAVVLPSLPLFWADANRIIPRGDFTQYAARHEHLRQAVWEQGNWPERSHLLGGGYPIIGDPEDPSLNPTTLLTIVFGTITGLKLLGLLAQLVWALGMRRYLASVLQLTPAAAWFGGLIAGLALWTPVRMLDGNPNEIGYAWMPWIAAWVARPGYKGVFASALALYTWMSDGKLAFVTGGLFLGILVTLGGLARGGSWQTRSGPWLRLALATLLAVGGGMFRILPALEVINQSGGLSKMDLWFHADEYGPKTISAYSVRRLLDESLGLSRAWIGQMTSICLGPIPCLLALLGLPRALRKQWPLVVSGLVFAWLSIAHRAPFDLFRLLWDLPVFSAIDAPSKYFSAPLVFVMIVMASLGLDFLLTLARSAWRMRILVAAGVLAGGYLAVQGGRVSLRSYTLELPPAALVPSDAFHQVRSDGQWRGRLSPWNANTYTNVRRGVGTVDWYTGIPLAESVVPKFIVTEDGRELPVPAYRGEAWFLATGEPVDVELSYESILVRRPPASVGTLVINQNAGADWSTNNGRISSHRGLLAVEIDGSGRPIALQYASRALRRGALISGAFLAAVALGLTMLHWRRRRRLG